MPSSGTVNLAIRGLWHTVLKLVCCIDFTSPSSNRQESQSNRADGRADTERHMHDGIIARLRNLRYKVQTRRALSKERRRARRKRQLGCLLGQEKGKTEKRLQGGRHNSLGTHRCVRRRKPLKSARPVVKETKWTASATDRKNEPEIEGSAPGVCEPAGCPWAGW